MFVELIFSGLGMIEVILGFYIGVIVIVVVIFLYGVIGYILELFCYIVDVLDGVVDFFLECDFWMFV